MLSQARILMLSYWRPSFLIKLKLAGNARILILVLRFIFISVLGQLHWPNTIIKKRKWWKESGSDRFRNAIEWIRNERDGGAIASEPDRVLFGNITLFIYEMVWQSLVLHTINWYLCNTTRNEMRRALPKGPLADRSTADGEAKPPAGTDQTFQNKNRNLKRIY